MVEPSFFSCRGVTTGENVLPVQASFIFPEEGINGKRGHLAFYLFFRWEAEKDHAGCSENVHKPETSKLGDAKPYENANISNDKAGCWQNHMKKPKKPKPPGWMLQKPYKKTKKNKKNKKSYETNH